MSDPKDFVMGPWSPLPGQKADSDDGVQDKIDQIKDDVQKMLQGKVELKKYEATLFRNTALTHQAGAPGRPARAYIVKVDTGNGKDMFIHVQCMMIMDIALSPPIAECQGVQVAKKSDPLEVFEKFVQLK